jgi:hypothetical protein
MHRTARVCRVFATTVATTAGIWIAGLMPLISNEYYIFGNNCSAKTFM